MKKSLFAFFLVLSVSAQAQTDSLAGQWKLYAIGDQSMYIDLDKDSVWMEQGLENLKDTAKRNLFFKAVRSSFGSCFFRFGPKANVTFMMFGKPGSGTYKASPAHHSFETTMGAKAVRESYHYEFRGETLVIASMNENSGMPVLYMRREQ